MPPVSTGVKSLTIAEVLAEFLAEQQKGLSPRTFTGYRDVVSLLQRCLDNYAYQSLDKPNARLFDRLYDATGSEHREYCEVFGPEQILPEIPRILHGPQGDGEPRSAAHGGAGRQEAGT